jgi:hypothetical protein
MHYSTKMWLKKKYGVAGEKEFSEETWRTHLVAKAACEKIHFSVLYRVFLDRPFPVLINWLSYPIFEICLLRSTEKVKIDSK